MTIKLLGIHGLGGNPDAKWQMDWRKAISETIPTDDVAYDWISYDPLFKDVDISAGETLRTAYKLLWNGVSSVLERPKGIGAIPDVMRFTAGYIVAWAEDDAFKRRTRTLILDKLREHRPTALLAHSLGSLLTYDALIHPDADEPEVAEIIRDMNLLTFGSQITNGFVLGRLSNLRVSEMKVRRWTHLHNRWDLVFTDPIELPGRNNFLQLETPFCADWINHRAPKYLCHAMTASGFWRALVRGEDTLPTKVIASGPRNRGAPLKAQRKALLVGVNTYRKNLNQLLGCVNDCFTMSAVLQECGFDVENIRLLLDERATAVEIKDRMKWLLADLRPGDEAVFYFSGHGVQMVEYGPDAEPDRHIEALAPHDFDWTPETCITDKMIYSLYSQLLYASRFVIIVDACHSGGVHRGGATVKGLIPPDDIRHRELRWDIDKEMWVPRKFRKLDEDAVGDKAKKIFGSDGATERLARASFARGKLKHGSWKKGSIGKGPDGVENGPYLPVIIEACAEHEKAFEYQHGATSHGAFTFCLASLLRQHKEITFKELVTLTGKQLAELGYKQKPQILAPSHILTARIPWKTGGALRRKDPKDSPGAYTPPTT